MLNYKSSSSVKIVGKGVFFCPLPFFSLPCLANIFLCFSYFQICSVLPKTHWMSPGWPPSIKFTVLQIKRVFPFSYPPGFLIIPVWEFQSFKIITYISLSLPPTPKECSIHDEIFLKSILFLHFYSPVTKAEEDGTITSFYLD